MKDVQEKINNNRYINRDKKIIEDNSKKNKYTKLEEQNYAEIKRRMNEKISNSLAYKNRKVAILVVIFFISLRGAFDLGFMAIQFSPVVLLFMPMLREYLSKSNK